MIYFSAVLFIAALAGWGWMVFGDHFTWADRRRELCKIGDHWMTTTPLIWHNKQGEYFSGTHCRACDFQKVIKVEK
jgi:hypothetical protein